MSFSDIMRDEKRNLYRNLKMLIIDEISLVDSDMIYKIDLRLREITQMAVPFGNVAVIVLGDLMQMCPISGRYIFLEPVNSQFTLAHDIDPLWRKFMCINLEINHRQGKDKSYADMLNRMRVGKQTEEDLESLKSKVRPKGDSDLKAALFISAKVKPVKKFNEIALNKTPGKLYVSKARHMQALSKSFKPKIVKKSGRIGDTQFVDELNLKKGARVMLISNIDVSDLLSNGTVGTVLGVEEG